ncbi:hypothetical protein VTO73DRAFT_7643 [Trametes versicolor]
MSSPSPPPPDLTSARMSYAAAVLGCFTYGIYAVLACICVHFLLKRRSKTRSQRIVLVYTVAMFIVGTGYFIAACVWSEVEFVESTVDISVFDTLLNSRLAILKDTFYTVNIWLADSLLLYRLFIVWNGNLFILVVPFCLWIGAICTGSELLVNSAQPLADLNQTRIINFQTAFYCLTISMNILCTLFIAGRLWYQQRLMKQYGNSAAWGYSEVIAVVIESAALYSACGILYIPLIINKLPLQFPITALIGSLTSIAPSLIILRVALGTAVTAETKVKTSLVFKLSKLRGGGGTSASALGATVGSSITASVSEATTAGGSKLGLADSALGSPWVEGKVKPSIEENDSMV